MKRPNGRPTGRQTRGAVNTKAMETRCIVTPAGDGRLPYALPRPRHGHAYTQALQRQARRRELVEEHNALLGVVVQLEALLELPVMDLEEQKIVLNEPRPVRGWDDPAPEADAGRNAYERLFFRTPRADIGRLLEPGRDKSYEVDFLAAQALPKFTEGHRDTIGDDLAWLKEQVKELSGYVALLLGIVKQLGERRELTGLAENK